MKINIKDEAQAYLNERIPNGFPMILTTDDGSNKYSSLGGSCAIGDKFQIVILKEEDPDYTETLENNAGYDLKTSPNDADLMTNGLNISIWHNALALKDNSGILDGALSVVDWRDVKPLTDEEKHEQMVKLGDQIC
ncbi:iron-sulfur cluster biosynthesis family protein [Companilactobacillus suantsaicola]|uniref:Iron-sulfur cluster biosynthesis family protein n=1 Tax=Companilactobacillus suantsaicola TaxID=2487723 RepID=A0A4Z0JFZ9_9LACO|nr:iron-sulfur cluster biosynthesis family protein [Companilactobacillus suantsaicola]TGD21847.1 iron-sulfur cluster biosynthesis family protein [Companilactobacillus suantsaicola]